MENQELLSFNSNDRKAAKDYLRSKSYFYIQSIAFILIALYAIDPFSSEAERVANLPFKLNIKGVLDKMEVYREHDNTCMFVFSSDKSCSVDAATCMKFEKGDTLSMQILRKGEGAVIFAEKLTNLGDDYWPTWEYIPLSEQELAPYLKEEAIGDCILAATQLMVCILFLLFSYPRWKKLKAQVAAEKKMVIVSSIKKKAKSLWANYILLDNGLRLYLTSSQYENLSKGESIRAEVIPLANYTLKIKGVKQK